MADDLMGYLERGVADVVREIVAATADDPRETRFALAFAAASKRATARRTRAERRGVHVPPFLICSIASRCNLHCSGCYAWTNCICDAHEDPEQLCAWDWERIFVQASELGVSFALLAGGEPCLRPDVLEVAGGRKDMLFPVFTNGTLLDGEVLRLFDQHRNLVPVISVEGGEEETDARRGAGTYAAVAQGMQRLLSRRLLFGVSVTVTRDNLDLVIGRDFLDDLRRRGARAVVFVEYVPFDGSRDLAIDEAGRERLAQGVLSLRRDFRDMVLISFPRDEALSGGCLAAGRGFFHINARGGVEPCPFSPYSDTSLAECSLEEALDSPLFRRLRERGLLEGDHEGGCVLFANEGEVRAALAHEAGE